mmetsp:Transcript_28064/g.46224  ORF Transcript_28064/g.46224 Transcript_28064/m.46224 type:complete len:128 (+) Transcript_28064:731-1114(+)
MNNNTSTLYTPFMVFSVLLHVAVILPYCTLEYAVLILPNQNHHSCSCSSNQNPPEVAEAPPGGVVAAHPRRNGMRAPSSAERDPRWEVMSVTQYPGCTELIRTPEPAAASSRARILVNAITPHLLMP